MCQIDSHWYIPTPAPVTYCQHCYFWRFRGHRYMVFGKAPTPPHIWGQTQRRKDLIDENAYKNACVTFCYTRILTQLFLSFFIYIKGLEGQVWYIYLALL